MDFSDGNGSVGGKLIEVSEVEFIEHDIASDEDSAVSDGFEEIEIENEHRNHS